MSIYKASGLLVIGSFSYSLGMDIYQPVLMHAYFVNAVGPTSLAIIGLNSSINFPLFERRVRLYNCN